MSVGAFPPRCLIKRGRYPEEDLSHCQIQFGIELVPTLVTLVRQDYLLSAPVDNDPVPCLQTPYVDKHIINYTAMYHHSIVKSKLHKASLRPRIKS